MIVSMAVLSIEKTKLTIIKAQGRTQKTDTRKADMTIQVKTPIEEAGLNIV